MSQTSCSRVKCCQVTDQTTGDFSGFSLVGGDFPGGSVIGNAESTFVVDCPPGLLCAPGEYPVLVTLPENTVVFPYDPPQPGEPITLRIRCIGSNIVRQLPSTSTREEIRQTIDAMVAECAQSKANVTGRVNTATIATVYSNKQISSTCGGLKFSASPGGGMYLSDTKTAVLPSGMFTSQSSQQDADQTAAAHVASVIAAAVSGGAVQCGYWNTEQTVECADDTTRTVAAFTYFSADSQAAADQLAIDDAESQCPQGCDPAVEAGVWTVETHILCSCSGTATSSFDRHIGTVSTSCGTGGSCGTSQETIRNTFTVVTPFDCNVRVYGELFGTFTGYNTVRLIVNGITLATIQDIGPFDQTFPVSFLAGSRTVELRAGSIDEHNCTATVEIGPAA